MVYDTRARTFSIRLFQKIHYMSKSFLSYYIFGASDTNLNSNFKRSKWLIKYSEKIYFYCKEITLKKYHSIYIYRSFFGKFVNESQGSLRLVILFSGQVLHPHSELAAEVKKCS